jgi:hypothetical protein
MRRIAVRSIASASPAQAFEKILHDRRVVLNPILDALDDRDDLFARERPFPSEGVGNGLNVGPLLDHERDRLAPQRLEFREDLRGVRIAGRPAVAIHQRLCGRAASLTFRDAPYCC